MILIGVGANLPAPDGRLPLETCTAAVEALKRIPGLKFVTASPWYRTGAIPRSSQPDFCNGVARLEGEIAPTDLLAALHAIEDQLGRVRSVPNAARVIDLDIIDLNGAIRAIPPVILPHPRAHLRAFVLRPVLDVAPGWRHPTLRRGVAAMLVDLSPQAIEPWHGQTA
jgi:2-amino-4-hydroxy-6-hydroxymethyldihydropteridine diphosphokinase